MCSKFICYNQLSRLIRVLPMATLPKLNSPHAPSSAPLVAGHHFAVKDSRCCLLTADTSLSFRVIYLPSPKRSTIKSVYTGRPVQLYHPTIRIAMIMIAPVHFLAPKSLCRRLKDTSLQAIALVWCGRVSTKSVSEMSGNHLLQMNGTES